MSMSPQPASRRGKNLPLNPNPNIDCFDSDKLDSDGGNNRRPLLDGVVATTTCPPSGCPPRGAPAAPHQRPQKDFSFSAKWLSPDRPHMEKPWKHNMWTCFRSVVCVPVGSICDTVWAGCKQCFPCRRARARHVMLWGARQENASHRESEIVRFQKSHDEFHEGLFREEDVIVAGAGVPETDDSSAASYFLYSPNDPWAEEEHRKFCLDLECRDARQTSECYERRAASRGGEANGAPPVTTISQFSRRCRCASCTYRVIDRHFRQRCDRVPKEAAAVATSSRDEEEQTTAFCGYNSAAFGGCQALLYTFGSNGARRLSKDTVIGNTLSFMRWLIEVVLTIGSWIMLISLCRPRNRVERFQVSVAVGGGGASENSKTSSEVDCESGSGGPSCRQEIHRVDCEWLLPPLTSEKLAQEQQQDDVHTSIKKIVASML